MYLWRAGDSQGEVLDILVQAKRNKAAALRLMRKLLKKQGFAPRVLVTDKLRSYGCAKRELGLTAHHEQGLRKNNRASLSAGWCQVRSGYPLPMAPTVPADSCF